MFRCRSKSTFPGRPGWAPIVALLLSFGLVTAAHAADDNDGDGYDTTVDCNDNNPSIHPGATDNVCDGVDYNCDGLDIVDPDPVDGINNDGMGTIDDGFGACVYAVDGPGDVCKTAGRSVCQTPPGPVLSGVVGYGTLTCVDAGNPTIVYQAEGLGDPTTCSDGDDNDCDGLVDLADPDCQQPEICDGLDNDGDGNVDNGFDVGAACQSTGLGVCATSGVKVCAPDGTGTVCSAVPGSPKKEGAQFGNSCADMADNDCDGLEDAADPDCAGFGQPELCGNMVDDNGNGLVDEGFPSLGLPCTAGVGVCATSGAVQCGPDGLTTTCSATAGTPGVENDAAGTCHDLLDNDCDGLTDAGDPDCASAFSDLGVTCSLPYTTGKPGADCNGKHLVIFDGGLAEHVQADLLALDVDGTVLGTIENVGYGDEAHLASRRAPGAYKISSKTNKKGTRHQVFAPLPVLRVTGTRNGVEDVAYCSILPYLEVQQPDGVTISLDDESDVDVEAMVPLVNVDTLQVLLDGEDILGQIGIDPVSQFPTPSGGALCTNPGECVVQIAAGCGDAGLVPVEVRDLRVEGLDTMLAATAKNGSEVPDQVNTVRFNLSGLPPGGHVVFVSGNPLPLPKRLSAQCVVDDLADTGAASAFGIAVDSPFDQQVVATAPVTVQGKVCGGNEIAGLQINGLPVDVSAQTCTPGNGTTSANECYLPFAVPVPEKPIAEAAEGTAPTGAFKRGSNRVVADASDVLGNRTFNTDTVFGLGNVQSPAGTLAMTSEVSAKAAANSALVATMMAMTSTIDPAFVVGLEETAVQDFFNEKCQGAIDQYKARAEATLENKSLGTIKIEPGCSCDLNSPILLEDVTFTDSPADPTCKVDFVSGQINVRVNLPSIRIQVGVHDSCTDHGLFGECIARTKINVTAVTKIEDVAFDFSITEDQIENKTPPDPSASTFAWTVTDNDGTPLFASAGTCSGGANDGKTCYGPPGCPGGSCNGVVKNGKDQGFDPVISQNSSIECWGASVCQAFQVVAAVIIDVFTFGLADGFDIVDFLDFDFQFNEDFQKELTASEPDSMQLDEIEVNEDVVAAAGHAQYTAGPIDVEIEDGGLTVAFGADFSSQTVDPAVDETPGAVLTPARVPTVAEVISVGDEVTMLIADDVFGQIFASMKAAGDLEAQCTSVDGLTVDSLLPAEADGGCESLGEADVAGATARGLCHGIRGADCSALPPEAVPLNTATKAGVCAGIQGQDCSVLPLGQKIVCNATPARDIQASYPLLFCARQDMEPDFLIDPDNTADSTVDTRLILEDLNVLIALDRGHDGYVGALEDLDGCFSAEGNAAPDCKVFASCLDVTLRSRMGIDPGSCAANQAGFVFSLLEVIASGVQPGVLCSSAVPDGDEAVLTQSFGSNVVDTVSDAARTFTPPICVDGLTLGGVLDFHSDEAKLFGLTTDGGTGYSDYLGLTVGLGAPAP